MKLRTVVKGLTVAGTLAFASSAMADGFGRGSIKDAPRAAAFSWTGFYVGVNVGYAWGNVDVASNFPCPANAACTLGVPANIAAVGSAASGSIDANGFTGGVQAGYNWQSGSAVLGVEVDFNSFNLNGSRRAGGPFPATPGNSFATSNSVDSDWLLTFRARLGWSISPSLLVYATGGLAVADVRVANSYSDNLVPAAVGASGRSDTLTGWTIGGGIEWAATDSLIVRAEYLYDQFDDVNLGSYQVTDSVFTPPLVAGSSVEGDLSVNIFRVGVSWKFGSMF